MVSSSRCEIAENPLNPNAQERNEDGQRQKISKYEQSREERIRENLERMQKLGIFDLSLRVKALKRTPKARKTSSTRSTPPSSSPLPPPGPVRRSSRLQNVTPVTYSEAYLSKKDKPLESEDDLLREEGSKPEIYTEEHEKLLGSTEMSWTLFVDGVGKDGKRIYDPVNGKTCHQCRQKTLGRRTHCSKCNMVQGQFCGDCLYMRYGENVIEANQNQDWICPVCRGICNCSLCRQAKGWPPTGPLYRKISSLGYKSVAHYLIQTRSLKAETVTDSNSKPVSAKRSLPFTHVEETSTEMISMNYNTDPQVPENPQSESKNAENYPSDQQEGKMHLSDNEEAEFKQEEKTHFLRKEEDDCKQEEKTHFVDNEQGDCKLDLQIKLVCPAELNAENSLSLGSRDKETDILADKEYDCSNVPVEENVLLSHDLKGSFQIELQINENSHEFNGKKEKTYLGNSEIDLILTPELSPKSNKKLVRTIEPADDNIAARLRSRRNRDNEQEEHRPGVRHHLNGILPQHSAEADVSNSNSSSQATVTDKNSRRLRQTVAEGMEQEMNKYSSSNKADTGMDISFAVATAKSSKSKRKQIHALEPSPDSIAGRLRQRRLQVGGI